MLQALDASLISENSNNMLATNRNRGNHKVKGVSADKVELDLARQ